MHKAGVERNKDKRKSHNPTHDLKKKNNSFDEDVTSSW